MIVYVNEYGEIKDVGSTKEENLTPLEIDDEFIPADWSVAKICCYKIELKDGVITKFIPYIDSKIIEHIERQGQENIDLQAQVDYLAMMTDVEM